MYRRSGRMTLVCLAHGFRGWADRQPVCQREVPQLEKPALRIVQCKESGSGNAASHCRLGRALGIGVVGREQRHAPAAPQAGCGMDRLRIQPAGALVDGTATQLAVIPAEGRLLGMKRQRTSQ